MPIDKEILANRQAFHEFHILDRYEAGAVLVGTEVKSIMAGRIQLKDSYVSVKDGEVWLLNAHISPYSHGNTQNHEPLRIRKLLLHRKEIDKLIGKTQHKGLTLIATKLYLKDGWVKCELALAEGKKLHDKRDADRKKTQEAEAKAGLLRNQR